MNWPILCATILSLTAAFAQAKRPFYQEPLPPPPTLIRGSANAYANLAPVECQRRLRALNVDFTKVGPTTGVAVPVRFKGPLGGVVFHTAPNSSPFGILDCRLALTWAGLAPLLREHGVKSVRIDNFYRKHARIGGHGSKSQHRYGLAADVTSVTFDDGSVADVERDFHGQRGQPVCGPEARVVPPSTPSVRLRNLTCALAASGAFHHILTPNYDAAHRNHLHLDIKRDCKWYSIQ